MKKIGLWAIGLLILIALLMQYVPVAWDFVTSLTYTSSATNDTWQFILDNRWELGLGLFALVALGVGFYLTDKKMLVRYVFVTVLVLLVYGMYWGGELHGFQRRIGILYILAVVAAVMVYTHSMGKEKFTLGILVGAIFLMLGFSHHNTWDQFTEKLASISWSGKGGQVASTSPLPSGLPKFEATLNAWERTPLNPGGKCEIHLRELVPGQCVHVYDSYNNVLGNDCAGNLNLDGRFPAKFSAARGGLVSVIYTLSACRY